MLLKTCTSCGSHFYVNVDENWKRRCLSCYIAYKNGSDYDAGGFQNPPFHAELATALRRAANAEAQVIQLQAELNKLRKDQQRNSVSFSKDDLVRLRILTHPDKHSGSDLATAMTKKLNELLKH